MLVTYQSRIQTTKFYIVFFTCTCAPHLKKGSATPVYVLSCIRPEAKLTPDERILCSDCEKMYYKSYKTKYLLK